MGGEFRVEWIHVYVWLSPFPGHLELSQHLAISGKKKKKGFDSFFLNGGVPEISTELSEQLPFQTAYGQMAVLTQLTLMSPSKVSLCLWTRKKTNV